MKVSAQLSSPARRDMPATTGEEEAATSLRGLCVHGVAFNKVFVWRSLRLDMEADEKQEDKRAHQRMRTRTVRRGSVFFHN